MTEGRHFLELALETASEDVQVAERLELLAILCFLVTEELDLDAAIAIGERALAVAETETAPAQTGLVAATLALALAEAGHVERAVALAEQAGATLGGRGDHWALAAAGLLRAQVSAAAGDVSTVAVMAADAYHHSEAIGFDAFGVPAMLLEAWVAERHNDHNAATDAYLRALDLAGRAGFADHGAFALSGLASRAFKSGDLDRAEDLQRRALATAEAGRAAWAAAHVRVELARIVAAAGDTAAAERLYRAVLEWSKLPRQHGPRESLFVALAEDPVAAASAELAALGAARAVTAAAVAPA